MSTEARQEQDDTTGGTDGEAASQTSDAAHPDVDEAELRAESMRLLGEALAEGSYPDELGELIERLVTREVDYRLTAGAGPVPHVLGAVEEVMAQVPYIGKGGQTPDKAGGYRFRGIDAVMVELAPAFRAARLGLQSTVVSWEFHTEGKMTDARVQMAYRITSLVDGSVFECAGMGEGRDSSDKGANKAMSLAKKEALCSALMIATDEYDMAEAEHPEYEDRPSKADRPARTEQRREGTPPPARGGQAPRTYTPEEYVAAINRTTDYPTLRRLGDHIADAGQLETVVDGSTLRQRLSAAAATFPPSS